MNRPTLLTGDRFGVHTEGLGDAINAAQSFWSADGKARYNHLGLVYYNEKTFEALWTYRFSHLKEYFNCPIIIFRDRSFSFKYRQEVMSRLVAKYIGERYPIRQILAHIFPPFARSSWFPPVCSELVSKYEYDLGEVDWWKGVNPDSKVDEWRIRAQSKKAAIIYEGLWLWDKEEVL